jgi:protein TonB
MFDGVLTEDQGPSKLRGGLLASLGVHGAVLGIALLAPSHPATSHEFTGPIRFIHSVLPNAPAAPVAAVAPVRAKHHKRHTGPVLGHKIAPTPEPEVEVDAPDDVEVDLPDTGNNVIGTSAIGNTGPIGATPIGNGPGPVQIFDSAAGMTMPRRIAGENPGYTRQAAEAGVRGTVTARCEITPEGALEHCRILKGLPFMNDAVLSALATQRYTPVIFQGQPVRVEYVFNFRFELP